MDSTLKNSYFTHLLAVCGLCIAWAPWVTLCASEIQGFTEPYQDIDVAASEMGIVDVVEVKEGDRVQEDQVLVRLDAAVLELTREIAKSIKQSRGNLESAQEELELHTNMVSKLEDLVLRQHASHQEIERAQSQRRMSEARLKAVLEELEVKTLEYQRACLQLERRVLRSPINGIVTQICKDRGESVLLNDPVLVKVVQLDPLLIVFLVPAEQAQELKERKLVNVRLGTSESTNQGKIEFISPTADPQSGLTRVRVRLPNPEERLPCGVPCFLIIDGPSSSSPQLMKSRPSVAWR